MGSTLTGKQHQKGRFYGLKLKDPSLSEECSEWTINHTGNQENTKLQYHIREVFFALVNNFFLFNFSIENKIPYILIPYVEILHKIKSCKVGVNHKSSLKIIYVKSQSQLSMDMTSSYIFLKENISDLIMVRKKCIILL